MHVRSLERLMPALALALAASLAAPSGALAQTTPVSENLTITTIAKSANGGKQTAEQRVIQNAADYAAFFGGAPPSQPAVDFSREDVLAVSMGVQRTGGYGIEITKATLQTFGFTGGMAFVEIAERRPGPNDIVTMALTAPVHVAKVKKGAYRYVFNTVAPQASFTSLDLSVASNPLGWSHQLILEASGKARFLQASRTARYAPIDGQATTAELQAVKDAFRNARVESLPAGIPDPRTFVMMPPQLELVSKTGANTYTLHATEDYFGAYESRVKPLVDALNAISTRLKSGSTFDKILLNYSGGLVMWSDALTVASDGTATVNRTGFRGTPSRLYTGRATAAELQALKDAVKAADVQSLPAYIDDPIMIMDIPSLRIVTTLSGRDYTTDVHEAGFYGAYNARLKPVVAAVRAICDRIVQAGSGQTVTGVVRVRGTAVYVGAYYVSPGTLTTLIARLPGRTVTVTGDVTAAGSNQSIALKTVRATTLANLNLRDAPQIPSTIVRVLSRGTDVEIDGVHRSGLWVHVTAGSDTGWVYRSYVRISR